MANRDLMPWGRRNENIPARFGGVWESPFMSLRREMDRLLSDVTSAGNMPTSGGRSAMAWPSIDVNETDNEVKVTAELPGMNQDDIDLRVDDHILSISGERKDERGDKDRGYSERYYGRFERRIALPRDVDEKACNATFRDGVLTVTFPKSNEEESGRKIPINEETKH